MLIFSIIFIVFALCVLTGILVWAVYDLITDSIYQFKTVSSVELNGELTIDAYVSKILGAFFGVLNLIVLAIVGAIVTFGYITVLSFINLL
jgi:hypothetical protein